MFRTDHTCSVCRVRGKDIQIHHIDGNRSNNSLENLVVLCLDCHSKVTGPRGLGKAYREGEVRRYKRAWEQEVLASRNVHRPIVKYKYKKELFSQIDLITCEILAVGKNSPRMGELLNILWELHLWRGTKQVNEKIIEGLQHLSLMSGLSHPRLASLVAEKLWEMCFHFVGPKDVSMGKEDLRLVLKCIDALSTLATFNCEFGHGRKATEIIAAQAENFFEIGLWYSKRRIANAVINLYKNALEACYPEKRLEFSYGRNKLNRSIRRAIKMLADEKLPWKDQRNRLVKLTVAYRTNRIVRV